MNGYGDQDDDDDEAISFLRSDSKKPAHKQMQALEVERRYEADSEGDENFGCKLCSLLIVLVVVVGIWRWSSWVDAQNTTIQQWNELRLDDVKHWCLNRKSHECLHHCVNPLEPFERFSHKTWEMAHDGNIREALEAENVEVVFLGDSIIEGWRGMSLGIPVPHKHNNIAIFDKLFHQSEGADFEGLALGIAGDKSPNLLWRIQNGEVPASLAPPVFWILIGTNDFERSDYCSPGLVAMGIERVVEEVRLLRPTATIVVNSLLPRADHSDDGKLEELAIGKETHHHTEATVWKGIRQVNFKLQAYARRTDNVVFFNATDVFVQQTKQKEWFIPKKLMKDHLHPTALGYQKWGEAIVKELHRLMNADSSENGRRPLPDKKPGPKRL